MNIEETLRLLTVEEKAALVAGNGFMNTNPIPRLKIPKIFVSDGPHGVRKQLQGADNGVTFSEPTTCFPPAVTVASSWNKENAFMMAEAIADECKFYNVSIILGPGTNIKRNPRCGRNFEYYSEDPLLAGSLASSFIKGSQGNGVGVSLKHFACNNQENYRFMGNSVLSERSMRELYLKPFEIAVKNSSPRTLMCSYNQINGTFSSENDWLLNKVLRDEWGFKGLVMSDWGAVKDRVKGIKAGLDLEMPGDSEYCRWSIINAVKEGTLKEEELDAAVRRVLAIVEAGSTLEKKEKIDVDDHFEIATDIAIDGAVLLKNKNFPLKEDEKLLIIGDLFENMRFQGAGSSMINPIKLVTPKMAFDEHGINYSFFKGYDSNHNEVDKELIKETIEASKEYQKVLLFIGLTDLAESEGGDREDIKLPLNQLELISSLIKEGKEIDVLLFGGSVIELPFEKDVSSILYMALPGEAGGEATYSLLFGHSNPSGRLAETWIHKYEDVPYFDEYTNHFHELYKEDVFVGYRYYSTFDKEVLYPFGYGLSYSSFEYSDVEINKKEKEIDVSLNVRNLSELDGKEVVQIYVSSPSKNIFRPKKELKAFTKVLVKGKEEEKVSLSINIDDLRYWSPLAKEWVLEDGDYKILVAKNVNDIVFEENIHLDGTKEATYEKEVMDAYQTPNNISNEIFERIIGYPIPTDPKTKPLTMETAFIHYKKTFFGKILYGAVSSVATKQRKEGLKMPPSKERDNKLKGAFFLQRIFDTNSLRSLSMSSGGALPYHIAELMNYIANGRLIKGLMCLKNKYKTNPLPEKIKEK